MDAIDDSYPVPWWHTAPQPPTAPPFSQLDVVPETPPKDILTVSHRENVEGPLPILTFPEDQPAIRSPAIPIPPVSPPHQPLEPLQHSKNASEYLGTRRPRNTLRANQASMKAFSRYLASHPLFDDANGVTKPEDDPTSPADTATQLHTVKKLLFTDHRGSVLPNGFENWCANQLKRIRFFLIEFAVNYRSEKETQEVRPSTMKGYILGIQCFFRHEWGFKLSLLEGPVFNRPKEGLMAVLDNRFSAQQSDGMRTNSHNTLSTEDLHLLYGSQHLSRDTPQGFQARLVFSMALITAMRPTALVELTTQQVTKERRVGEDLWVITAAVGSRVGASKSNPGEYNAVRDKPPQTFIWNRVALEGLVNVYQNLEGYMEMRKAIVMFSNLFFWGLI